FGVCAWVFLFSQTIFAQMLDLPSRPAGAMQGSVFAKSIESLNRTEREEKVYEQIALGNVPDFMRHLCPVHVGIRDDDVFISAVYYVAPDYLCVGSDSDYFF